MPRVLNFSLAIKQIKSLLKACTHALKKVEMQDPLKQDIFKPPSAVRGMLELDRDAFSQQVDVPAVLVPLCSLQKFNKAFKSEILRRRGTNLLNEDGTGSENVEKYKFVAMKPDFDFSKLSPSMLEKFRDLGVESEIYSKRLDVRFESYKHQEILGAILPADQEVTSSFERVGHIIHVNLLEHQLRYKKVIGQVLLETHKHIKTVVNKSSTIDNTYRNFHMEVIAGEENFITRVIEYGCSYEFDFSKVFWNSRLQEEHRRISEAIPEGSTVFDVFAGVGPFSIPLSKKRCKVLANDLNEESYKWLQHNARLNKTKLDTFNLDGREFIRVHLRKYLRSAPPKHGKIFVIMNLPALAVEFLDAFRNLVDSTALELPDEQNLDKNVENERLPTLHVFCYAFSSVEDKIDDVRDRAASILGRDLPEEHNIRAVRKVAPGKEMFCLSFDCPISVLLKRSDKETAEDSPLEPKEKKPRLTESPS